MLIPAEQFLLCRKAMLVYGMQLSDPTQDIQEVYDVPYGKLCSPLYIELHKSLFSTDSDNNGELNRYFDHVHEWAIEIQVDGVPITTMEYKDHLFYLVCHVFKHFQHNGVGIRQTYANLFTATLFQVDQKYLTFDPVQACYQKEWQEIQVDETMLMMDLLDAGIYVDGSMSRKLSSNITLNAVSSRK